MNHMYIYELVEEMHGNQQKYFTLTMTKLKIDTSGFVDQHLLAIAV